MEITEVRIKLMGDPDDRLRAFCSVTFDDAFVVRDLKIIKGATGPFVAMPSRKLTRHCRFCRFKNHLRASFCNQCGKRQKVKQSEADGGREKLYADIAHPINAECRELIQSHVIHAYEEEKILASKPGYVPRYDEGMDYDDGIDNDLASPDLRSINTKGENNEIRPPNASDSIEKQSSIQRTDTPNESTNTPAMRPSSSDLDSEESNRGHDVGS